MKTYRIADNPTLAECEILGIPRKTMMRWLLPRNGQYIAAVRIFEFRPPKAGEWYLSGTNSKGETEAWRAPNDLNTTYHIAQLAVIDRKTTITETIYKAGNHDN